MVIVHPKRQLQFSGLQRTEVFTAAVKISNPTWELVFLMNTMTLEQERTLISLE